MEVVSSVAEKIVECLFDSTRRQLGYLFDYSNNIEALKEETKKFADAIDRVQGEIDVAKRNGEIIVADVQSWITKADNTSAEAEQFLDEEVKANKRCLKGWCINLKQRYQFSKEAKQRTLVVSQHREDGKFQNVSRPAPPPGIISSYTGSCGIFESRQSIMKKIMDALDDASIHIIGVCGMGGVGKTTLVKEIAKLAKETKLYDAVAMAVVSQTPSILNIQAEIAHMLGLTKLSDNVEQVRASSILGRIKQEKRILIILDDVWGRIDLDKIGIPFWNDHGGCKIILTSRRKNVCDQMNCDKTFVVGTLSKQESWVLFKELAGTDVENSVISSIAREIAAKCGGLPIAIVTIARALKNKDKDEWVDAARQLRKSTPTTIEGMHENVISSLELSYNYLSNEAKSLFLFCSLFPEDFNISIEILVRYGTGLRWFSGLETMEEIRVRTRVVVSTLISSFLLTDGDRHYGNCVKMHDVVRDVAHVIAPKYNHMSMVKGGMRLREWPSRDTYEDLTGISLMYNDIEEVPEGLNCPKLQSLLLQENYKLVIPDNFFERINDLKILDLSGAKILPLPNSLSLLANLRTLHLVHCKLGELSMIGQLRNLEILSFDGSDIREIPKSFSQLSHLRLLDLNSRGELKLISNGVISCLRKLEELYMLSFKQWDHEGEGDSTSNIKLFELQGLSNLTTLHIHIPNPNIIPNEMISFKNLTSFHAVIGREYIVGPTTRESKLMSLSKMSLSEILESWIKNLLEKTQDLILSRISGLKNTLHDLLKECSTNLKSLDIIECETKYLLNTLEWTPNLAFHNLEKLGITDNSKLVEICHGELPAYSFSKLKDLEVASCSSLPVIVPSNLLQRFQSLQSLTVRHCESVVHIFDCEGLTIANGETKFLSSLEDIYLLDLPEMTHIWNGDTQILNHCNLRRVTVIQCSKLMGLFSPSFLQSLICLESLIIMECRSLAEIFYLSPSGLQNLISVVITGCHKLKKLFTPSILQSLVKLRRLELWDCSTIEEIITNEEGAEKEESTVRITLPNLYDLELVRLGNITCFSSGSYSIEYPALQIFRTHGCPKMKTFGYGDQLTPKLKGVYTSIGGESRWMGNLNATVEQLFKEQVIICN